MVRLATRILAALVRLWCCRVWMVPLVGALSALASPAQPHPNSAAALEAQERVWQRFATGLSESSGMPYTADGLRKLLPTTPTADVAWSQVYMDAASWFVENAEAEGMTAHALLDAVELQASLKINADVSMGAFGQPPTPKETGWAELNEALWKRYAADLADALHMREVAPGVSAEDLLWVLSARQMDRAMLEQGVSAEELLQHASVSSGAQGRRGRTGSLNGALHALR